MYRLAGPRVEDNDDFDISGSLIPSYEVRDQEPEKNLGRKRKIADVQRDEERITSQSDEEEGNDEKFFAAQQTAVQRAKNASGSNAAKKSGGFQSMGLNTALLKAVTRKGFAVPTPIQRKTIPLILDHRDVVGMARTGSGKTAAFVIPMIEKLKSHSVTVGARAILLSPSRELALQTLKAVKEFGRGTDLRTVLLVGGDSFEDQFSQMTSNPDIIIATPGRFLHLLVEMRLDLSTVRYIVFDEADRLFEMGFAVQLNEILHALPPSRQSLLFSATLPATLVEFAKAGLQDPILIRLDAESKMSPDLQSAFLSVKSSDKEGALLHLLQDVIKMPTATDATAGVNTIKGSGNIQKRKKSVGRSNPQDSPTEHSTVVFAATKHHVEYLATLLQLCGYAVSYVYGSLDQTARLMQVEAFRAGTTSILIVTDVAARGIDIPMLANVINYDFTSQPKLFLHRVGRTARAGRKGWSYSLIQPSDLPYLLDLQLFLGKKLVCGWNQEEPVSFAEDITLGTVPVTELERSCEAIIKLLDENEDLLNLRSVAMKGEKLFLRTRNPASLESVRRAKEISTSAAAREPNMLFIGTKGAVQTQREDMLARIGGFRPTETIFEFGKRGVISETAEVVRRTRQKIRTKQDKNVQTADESESDVAKPGVTAPEVNLHEFSELGDSDNELEVTLTQEEDGAKEHLGETLWHDSEYFMSYVPRHSNLVEERGYGVQTGSNSASNFVNAARDATMSLTNDESKSFGEASRPRQMRWDKRSKKYVATANDEDGSKGKRLVRGESGQKIAATFRSGRFDDWRKQNRIGKLPRTGETESAKATTPQMNHKRFKHYAERQPKQPDKYRDDYFKKKKKLDGMKQDTSGNSKSNSKPRQELRSVDDIRKARKVTERKREKNARPPKRKA